VSARVDTTHSAIGNFFDRARARLTLEVPPALTDPSVEGVRGDLDLNPEVWSRAGVKATRPAAVLVPIIDRSEPTVLLTLRTAELASHAGQVAFPGGKIEPADESPVAAALARVKPDFRLVLNPWEVTETFEVPLKFLMTPSNHQRKTRDWNGFARDYYEIPYQNHYIWGITAGILRNLYERVYGA